MLNNKTIVMMLILVLYFRTSCADNKPITIANYSETKYQQTITDIYEHCLIPAMNLNTRITKLSHYFLGEPYILGALGEGKRGQYDKSPFYRTDAFDCLTYVSTVLALAKATDINSFEKILAKIQYHNGKIAYTNRYHFVELDWNRENQRLAYIQDVTNKICNNCVKAKLVIDKPAWFRHANYNRIKLLKPITKEQAHKLLADLRQHATSELCTLSVITYIPLTELFGIDNRRKTVYIKQDTFSRIPNVAIIEIVDRTRQFKAKVGTDLSVVHMGFVIRNEKGLMFRHASSEYHKIVEVPLAQYLIHYFLQAAYPKLMGIHIEKIL